MLNSFQWRRSVIGEREVVVGREGAGKSGEWLADRGVKGIREVADELEYLRTASRTLSG